MDQKNKVSMHNVDGIDLTLWRLDHGATHNLRTWGIALDVVYILTRGPMRVPFAAYCSEAVALASIERLRNEDPYTWPPLKQRKI
jgi:hypothetical protein